MACYNLKEPEILQISKIKLSQPADVVTIGYQLILMITIVLCFSNIPGASGFLFYHALIIGFVLGLPYLGKGKIINLIRNWSPVLIVPTNFAELHYLVHNLNPIDLDSILIELDLLIFGVHPTVWLESLTIPLLTEYFQWIYTTFYFIPIILGIILYRNSRFSEFYFLIFAFVLGFYLSYIGYFIVPAIGPRFTIDHLQTGPLTGVWLTTAIREALNHLENVQRDAFPSGHTEITLLTMMYAKKYSKSYFYILLVIGTSLIISTVYVRYHYVVDVMAGIVLAIVVFTIAPVIYTKIRNLDKILFRSPH